MLHYTALGNVREAHLQPIILRKFRDVIHGVIQAVCAGCSRHRGAQCLLIIAGEADSGDEAQSAGAPEASAGSPESESRGGGKGLQFSDKDEHMYFWFPLLAGLSELTFDPRPDIRYSALEVHLSPDLT